MARGLSKIIETVGTTAIVIAELNELDAVTLLSLIYATLTLFSTLMDMFPRPISITGDERDVRTLDSMKAFLTGKPILDHLDLARALAHEMFH